MSGYSRSPKLLKGALIQFSAPLFVPIPNIIVFQYNPETLSRSVTPWVPPLPENMDHLDAEGRTQQSKELAQPYDPTETFSVVLELDAADALEHPESHPVAAASGVADRIAAIEMLCYPSTSAVGGLLGDLAGSVSGSIGAGGIDVSLGGGGSAKAKVPEAPKVPIVLFFWGPGRIVPVRVTSFGVEEQAFSPMLYPIRAKVSLGLKVLTPDNLPAGGSDMALKIARTAYTFTRAQKELLATANLANSVESIVSMLPL